MIEHKLQEIQISLAQQYLCVVFIEYSILRESVAYSGFYVFHVILGDDVTIASYDCSLCVNCISKVTALIQKCYYEMSMR